MSEDQRHLLEEDSWFGALPPTLRGLFLRMARPKRARHGEHIYRVGDAPDGLYAVLSGEIQMVGYPHVGTQLLYTVLRRGDWFGQISVLDGKPRSHDAISVGASSLLHVTLQEFTVAAEAEPQLYRALALLGCLQQRKVFDYLGLILTRTPEDRLAAFLLDMTCRKGTRGESPLQSVRVTQETLSGIVGVSRQSLNKLIKLLEGSGTIKSKYGVITILDREGLSALAYGREPSESALAAAARRQR